MKTPWEGGHVLVVQRTDDGLADALAAEGLSVEQARDGQAALRAIEESPFDVIVLEHGLPGRSGADLAADLACYVDTELVLVADDASCDAVRALNARRGAVVLLRPLAPGELEAWVRYEVVSRRMRGSLVA